MTSKRSLLRGVSQTALVTVFGLLLCIACSRQPSYPPAAQSGPNIVIDAAGLENDIPKFFTYQYQGRNISYFVLKIQGKIISFLDACASCYPHKMGYRYNDRHVICRFCSQEFPIDKLEKGLGNCFPIKIEGRLENGKYLILIATLEAEAGKF
jgi:uncharacterized membrane protein